MKRVLGLLAVVGALALTAAPSFAQNPVKICLGAIGGPCQVISASNPFPVTGTIAATTAATAAAALPSLSAGTGKAIYESLSGGLYVQPIVGTNIVDATHGVPVVAQTGSTWSATQSGTWNITNVSGTVSLPTGASTSALQSATQAPVAPGAATATVSTLLGCQYNSSGVTFTNGQQGSVQCGPAGSLFTVIKPTSDTGAGITSVVSSAAEGSHVLKASAGNLYDVYVTTGATAGYLLVFNATSAPGDGAVTPIHCVVAPANTTTSLAFGSGPPSVFSTGITAVFSTTGCFTKTISATAFIGGRTM